MEGDYIGKSVYIGGQFRSFNRHEEKKNRLVLSVFARELEVLDSDYDEMQPIRFSLTAISARRLYTGKHRLDEKLQTCLWQ